MYYVSGSEHRSILVSIWKLKKNLFFFLNNNSCLTSAKNMKSELLSECHPFNKMCTNNNITYNINFKIQYYVNLHKVF
jgi:hypothetical protein